MNEFIRHDDFGKVLELAAALRHMQAATIALADGQKGTNDNNSLSNGDSLHVRKKNKMEGKGGVTNTISSSDNQPSAKSFSDAAGLIRATLISDDESDDMCEVMGRGECLITDSLIDETIQCLAEELKLCVELKKRLRMGASFKQQGGVGVSTSASVAVPQPKSEETDAKMVPVKMETVDRSGEEEEDGGGGGVKATKKAKGTNAQVPKFTKWQTDILIDWMIEHREHPFPTAEQIHSLAESVGLTDTQVVNWTTNVRKR